MNRIHELIAQELSVNEKRVAATVLLLDEGATVPFVARYRKELTGGMDDVQLRYLEERLRYLRELEDRRETIIRNIREQNKLTPELEKGIHLAETKTQLEDLYLPYKKKRRTKAQIAREAGLQSLARSLLEQPDLDPELEAKAFVNPDKEVHDGQAALAGAQQILMEEFTEDAGLLSELREDLSREGILRSRVIAGNEDKGVKFADYFHYDEKISKIPSHRTLALLRGRNEGILILKLDMEQQAQQRHPCELKIARHFHIEDKARAADHWLLETVRRTWRVKLHTRLELDLIMQLRVAAEEEAIAVFSRNLHDLLLAAPAGSRVTMGLDPGLRTGVKVAVVDATGKLKETATIYPHEPYKRWDESISLLADMAVKHAVELVSIGNGTASRETDKLVAELCSRHSELRLQRLIVSEAGASVYSASELASNEFPQLDVSLRGAVSIARRVQDPLAELVKIEPKSIGVGQYQHDVSATKLARSLDAVVEDCVNAVGVDVNTASAALLARVSGLNQGLASNIVQHRNTNGVFCNRKQLFNVPRLGPKAFEQSAGFLRINDGDDPLDASAVHPEAYPVVERIVNHVGKEIKSLLGDRALLKTLRPREFTDERFGLPTVSDIIAELEKPGRDPRPNFKTVSFKDGVETLEDLRPEMILEGVVTNVTNFGAFIDIGVHQDGLVHISAMAEKFVKDPREIVKAGDLVKVKVLEVDLKRKRIALRMRLTDDNRQATLQSRKKRTVSHPKGREAKLPQRQYKQKPTKTIKFSNENTNVKNSAMAEALRRAMKR